MTLARFFTGRYADAAAREVSHEELVEALGAGACVVDVREPHEFADGHIPGSINLPLSRVRPERLPAGRRAVLVCLSGARSALATRHAHAAGATEVRHYARGMNGWRARGGPIAR